MTRTGPCYNDSMGTPTTGRQDISHGANLGRRFGIVLLACVPVATSADEAAPWRNLVDRTIAEACAIRQLPMKRPVEVRPMTTFEGGYTKGIGSTVWEEQYARAWRDGWCAVGVYCERESRSGDGSNSPNRPRGLYDHSANVLYVDVEADDYEGTVAHEFTHALQHQNFPALNALHLWYNRDLAAAGNAVIEGGAHVVGWSFRPDQRTRLCMMTPDEGGSRRPHWWDWSPDDFKAHEMFPHAFGPAISFEALLAGGTSGTRCVARQSAAVHAGRATACPGRARGFHQAAGRRTRSRAGRGATAKSACATPWARSASGACCASMAVHRTTVRRDSWTIGRETVSCTWPVRTTTTTKSPG